MRLPRPQFRITPYRAIAAVLLVIILAAGWHLGKIEMAYGIAGSAPQGQFTGPAQATLTITEFMDYPCPPCRRMKDVLADVQARHPEVRIVYRDLPTEKDVSIREAGIAAAAGLQNHFAQAHDALLTGDPVTDDSLYEFCRQNDLNCPKLEADMRSRPVLMTILETVKAAEALHIHAVPAFVIGHTVYASAKLPTAEDLDAMIASAEAQK